MSFKRSALLAAASLGVAGIASAAPSIGVKYVDNGNAGVQSGNVDSLGAAESAGWAGGDRPWG